MGGVRRIIGRSCGLMGKYYQFGLGEVFRMGFADWDFVTRYQFGKYTNNIGPQTVFPVPQGKMFQSLYYL